MTSLRGPGERNFNAVSHKPTRAPIQSIQSVPVSFGLWDTALKFLSPGPRSDVTDHLVFTSPDILPRGKGDSGNVETGSGTGFGMLGIREIIRLSGKCESTKGALKSKL